eukprot:620101_1
MQKHKYGQHEIECKIPKVKKYNGSLKSIECGVIFVEYIDERKENKRYYKPGDKYIDIIFLWLAGRWDDWMVAFGWMVGLVGPSNQTMDQWKRNSHFEQM